jgi:uncharacterized protein YdeI (YjbR/CyaY-like superfamily)
LWLTLKCVAGKPRRLAVVEQHVDGRQIVEVSDRAAWRQWLAERHHQRDAIWLVFHKKTSDGTSPSYDEAVEEALCFGWIDSIVKRIDDEKFAQKFTPRRAGSNWSASNLARIKRLVKEGKMAPAGLAKIDGAFLREKAPPPRRKADLPVPRFMMQALKANRKAWENFQKLAPSYRRMYIGWIMHAKKQETRERRLKEAVTLLEQNKKLGLK